MSRTETDELARTGWARLPGLSWHHFVAGTAVCGRGLYLGNAATRGDRPVEGEPVCVRCQRIGYGAAGRPPIDLRGGNAVARARDLVKSPGNATSSKSDNLSRDRVGSGG